LIIFPFVVVMSHGALTRRQLRHLLPQEEFLVKRKKQTKQFVDEEFTVWDND